MSLINLNAAEKRELITDIFKKGIEHSSAYKLMCENIDFKNQNIKVQHSEFNIEQYKRIWVIGVGRSSAHMAKRVEELLKDKLTGGVVITTENSHEKLKKIKVLFGDYPLCGKNTLKSTDEFINFLGQIQQDDLVISLISGNGASLLVKIPDGLTLKDILNINAFLINAGAKKSEIVTVRNHMSLVKGGRLLDYFRAKKIINIVLSDVLSNNYNEVSSGPTMWDFTTYKDAYEILCRYRIKEKISQNALKYFEKMIKKPKNIAKNLTDEKIKVTSNYVIANNKVLVERTIDRARQLGFNTSIDLLSLEFEAHQIARRLSDNAREISLYGRPIQKPACIISSGFTNTSNMFYKKSGMNLNLALITATEIKDMNETFVLTGNSSGYDGITDSAGAVVDGATFKQAQKKKMRIDEYLKNNDSYGFFKKMNHLVKTGNSGTCLGNIFITCIF